MIQSERPPDEALSSTRYTAEHPDSMFYRMTKTYSFHQPDAKFRAASALIAHAVIGWLPTK
jgi:hypothetical protein